MYCFVAMFVYFWLPNCVVQAMSNFNWITWIAPNNVILAAVTGGIGGLGFNPVPTFDWNHVTANVDPLVFPFYSTINIFLGMLITAPIIFAVWYTNTWNTAYLAINDNHVWNNTGKPYQVSKVINNVTLFDEAGYKAYSPAYLSAGYLVLNGTMFAIYTATITHTILYHRHEIAAGFRDLIRQKSALTNSKDIHTRLMKNYREVPEYVYFGVFVVSIALGAAGIGAYPTNTSPAVVLYGGMHLSLPVHVLSLTSPCSFPRCNLLYP